MIHPDKLVNKKVNKNQRMVLVAEHKGVNTNSNFDGRAKFVGNTRINKISQGRQTRSIRTSMIAIGDKILLVEGNREQILDSVFEELNRRRKEKGETPYASVSKCPKEEFIDILLEYPDIRLFGLTPSASGYNNFKIQGAMAIENAYSLNEVFHDDRNSTITSCLKEFANKEKTILKEGFGIGKKHEIVYSLTTTDAEIQKHKAEANKLTYEDIVKLDHHMITAVQKNSSYTKVGSTTALYFRIDQNTEDFVIEPLGDYFEFIYLTDARKVISFRDYEVDATKVINRLKKYNEHIDTIYFYELGKVVFVYKEEVEEVEEVKNEKVTVKKIVEHRGNFIELLENFTNIKVCEISPVLANNNYYGYEGKKTE